VTPEWRGECARALLAVAALTLGERAGRADARATGDELPIRRANPGARAEAAAVPDEDMVLGVVVGREARAYPVAALWALKEHTVNDELDGEPLVVSMCSLAGVARAYSRKLDARVLDVGNADTVDRGSLVLYDRNTVTRWDLIDGDATEGPLLGRRLRRLPALFTTWGTWKSLHPDTTVHLGPGSPPAMGLNAERRRRILLAGRGLPTDRDWIVGFREGDYSAALLVRSFVDVRIANVRVRQRPVVVFVTADRTTLVTWQRRVGERELTFAADGDRMIDRETGSAWDPFAGRAVSGPMKGRILVPAVSSEGFWHAWKAHHVDTVLIDPLVE